MLNKAVTGLKSFIRSSNPTKQAIVDTIANADSTPFSKENFLEYAQSLPPNELIKVVLGGHWSDNAGWLVLNEKEQDITQKLVFPDSSIDVLFTEHVFEHVSFTGGVVFLKEALRVLKKGGILRLVCPMLERLLQNDLETAHGRSYVDNALVPQYSQENRILSELNLNGLHEAPEVFLLNNVFREHGHQFIWSNVLLRKVMKSIGFSEVSQMKIAESAVSGASIERRRRGVYMGYDWREELDAKDIYDPESMVIEAKK